MARQNKNRIMEIRNRLKAKYPHVKTQLNHKNGFQLLVATILSAQCTDRQVNSVTPILFSKLATPEDFAAVPIERLEAMVRSTGFYKNKARHIQNCARSLIENFNGRVPDNIEDLTRLPGVGRKTANVVLGSAFGVPAMVVDTHVTRISKRLGLTKHKDATKIEFDLVKIIPKEDWNDFSLWLIYFGRAVCKARKPDCPNCFLEDLCKSGDKRE